MTRFIRYGVYAVPPENADWAGAATEWLGWDMIAGRRVPHPEIAELPAPIAALTERPRRYGLHGTLKPPFRLAEGQSASGLKDACRTLSGGLKPVAIKDLALTRMGRFLALCPAEPIPELAALAAATVEALEPFRAQPSDAELARRRARTLTTWQEANLVRWGYPYVMADFRFHLTLTGPLPKPDRDVVQSHLAGWLEPLLPTHWHLDALTLVGEGEDGFFRLIDRFALTG